jgi:hypothetical protein
MNTPDALNVLFKEFESSNKLLIKHLSSEVTPEGHIINLEMYAEGLPYLLSLLPKEEKMSNQEMHINSEELLQFQVSIEERPEIVVGNYSFFVKTTDIVSFVEISKCVSRKNPIAVITLQPELPEDIVLVHKTIFLKAELIDMIDGIESLSQSDDIHVIRSSEPKKIIEWARKVKRASWPKTFKTTEVRVIVPNI